MHLICCRSSAHHFNSLFSGESRLTGFPVIMEGSGLPTGYSGLCVDHDGLFFLRLQDRFFYLDLCEMMGGPSAEHMIIYGTLSGS